LNFKYWPDEPGDDPMVTWTESHYILFASAGLLAGQLYPDQVFANSGLKGADLQKQHRQRVLQWMNLRFFTGFSEWLSNVHFDEDLTALISLVDFCRDAEIRTRAAMLIDLLLFEMAANQIQGVFGCTHGRSEEPSNKWASQESTTDTFKLLFGKGQFTGSDNMSAAAFALSPGFRMPAVLYKIANDSARPELVHRQRSGICIEQSDWWNIPPKNFENGLLLLNTEAYMHPRVANLFLRMMDAFRWWEKPAFHFLSEHKSMLKGYRSTGVLPVIAQRYQKDIGRQSREEVNVYTYRTPDYLLSSAQDYHKGHGGDQQHVWQATLGPDAVCFTTHPAQLQGPPPNYWSGSGCLPRIAQHKNVLIAIYRLDKYPMLVPQELLPLTHAWLPRDRFEEIYEKDGWIFARYGEAYLALLSENPYEWRELPGEDQHREILVTGKRNIWICELGRRAVDGDFSEFTRRILDAEVEFSRSHVRYQSPSQGWIEFSWDGPFRHEDRIVSQEDYPRYASPYCLADFPPEKIHIELDGQSLDLDWLKPERSNSGLVD
jgi:hypothetical protein